MEKREKIVKNGVEILHVIDILLCIFLRYANKNTQSSANCANEFVVHLKLKQNFIDLTWMGFDRETYLSP